MTKIPSFEEPLAKIAKLNKERRRREGGGGGGGDDTDHIAELTQLKEKIASLQKTITAKNHELVAKQGEMNQVRWLVGKSFHKVVLSCTLCVRTRVVLAALGLGRFHCHGG